MKTSQRLVRMSFALLVLATPVAHAAGTAAGIDITNTASATFLDPDGTSRTVNSNTTALRVDEILDVTIVANDAGNVAVTTPDTNAPLSFTVTNTGNGSEAFALGVINTLGGDQFNPANPRIYLDNGDGLFDILTDTLYVAASNDPVLAADATQLVFVVSDIPAALNNNDVGLASLTAEAITAQATPGVDAPGTSFAGQGTNGSDAVVGGTQADASGQNGYVASQIATTLAKSQSVLDSFGNANAIPGAVITYTLTFSVVGAGNLSGSQITDAIPANTTYKPNSLTLNTLPLSDLADADAGSASAAGIVVNLGTVTAPATHTVTFQVTIN
jgi:uncharacterized repeat protein (TIGR01451 family)